MDGLENPESDESEDDSEPVADGVLVDTLVVGLVDGVVSVSVASPPRCIYFTLGRVDSYGHIN